MDRLQGLFTLARLNGKPVLVFPELTEEERAYAKQWVEDWNNVVVSDTMAALEQRIRARIYPEPPL